MAGRKRLWCGVDKNHIVGHRYNVAPYGCLRLVVRMPERNEDAVRNSQWATQTAQSDFNEARRRALLAALRDIFRGQPNAMLSFEEVRARLNVRGQRYLGRQVVPLDHIIGS